MTDDDSGSRSTEQGAARSRASDGTDDKVAIDVAGDEPATPHRAPRASADAAVGRRILAAVLDSVAVFAVLYAGMFAFGGPSLAAAVGLAPPVVLGFYLWYVFAVLGFAPLLVLHGYSPQWFLIGVGLWVVYGAVFETLWGATPGKHLTGIVVLQSDGSALGLRGAVVRNLLRFVDGLGFYLLGFIVLAASPQRQRLGDLLGDTIVVLAD